MENPRQTKNDNPVKSSNHFNHPSAFGSGVPEKASIWKRDGFFQTVVATNKQTSPSMRKLLLLLVMTPFSLFAQESDFGNWFIYFGDVKVKNRWNWHHEVQYRNFNFIGDTEQIVLRTGIGYNLTEDNNNGNYSA